MRFSGCYKFQQRMLVTAIASHMKWAMAMYLFSRFKQGNPKIRPISSFPTVYIVHKWSVRTYSQGKNSCSLLPLLWRFSSFTSEFVLAMLLWCSQNFEFPLKCIPTHIRTQDISKRTHVYLCLVKHLKRIYIISTINQKDLWPSDKSLFPMWFTLPQTEYRSEISELTSFVLFQTNIWYHIVRYSAYAYMKNWVWIVY